MKAIVPEIRDVVVAVILYTLNIVDMAATLFAIQRGYVEANPAMKFLLDNGVEYFVLYKTLVVLVFAILLLFLYIPRRVNIALLIMAVVYATLCFSHVLIFMSEHS